MSINAALKFKAWHYITNSLTPKRTHFSVIDFMFRRNIYKKRSLWYHHFLYPKVC